jgi:hypothetical protein
VVLHQTLLVDMILGVGEKVERSFLSPFLTILAAWSVNPVLDNGFLFLRKQPTFLL